jgi:O-acetylhomoserine (thiol)-lyase
MRDVGAVMTPFNAFLFLQGMETLALRMEAVVQSAQTVAEFLQSHSAVAWVAYGGLAESPYRDLAKTYLPKGPGGVFAFGVKGGRDAGRRFIEAVEICSHLANVGDSRTLVIHPASTTHAQLDEQALAASGVGADLVRISIGLENAEDICADIDQALKKAVS